jgi:polyphenol oxidase
MFDMFDFPQPNEGFRWVQVQGLPALVCDPLLAAADHLFTTRLWPLGRGEDQRGWQRVAEGLRVPASRLARVRQVHGAAVATAEEALAGTLEADAVLSSSTDVAIAIQTADCVPLLLADVGRGAVAAVHAGWRGLAARTIAAAVAAMGGSFGTEPSDLIAAIGPSIGACCYEVGDEVNERFAAAGFSADRRARWFSARAQRSERNPAAANLETDGRPGHWFFDGPLSARDQLERAGVNPLRIFGAGLCTASHSSAFCSYRRDGAPAGRMAAAIRSRQRP